MDRPLGLTAVPAPPDVIANHESAPRPYEPAGLRKEARGLRRVHERLDRIGHVRGLHAVGKIAEVTLDAGHTIGQALGLDALPRRPNLNRAQRDARAGDRQQSGEVAEARADTATEVDDMRRAQPAHDIGDAILDEMKCLLAGRGAGTPHGTMDGTDAAALSERDEGGRIPVVVAPNLFGVEWGHGLTDYASIHFDRRAVVTGQRGGACGWLVVIARPAASVKAGCSPVPLVWMWWSWSVFVVAGAEQDEVVELGLAAVLDGGEVVGFELARWRCSRGTGSGR